MSFIILESLTYQGLIMRAILVMFLFLVKMAQANTLEINFSGIRSDRGTIEYLVFVNKEGYPDKPEESIRKGSISILQAKNGLKLEDIPNGELAITFIHDENENKKLDTKIFGLPDEGVGFSNNPKIFFGVPSFDRAKIDIPNNKKIEVRMKYF